MKDSVLDKLVCKRLGPRDLEHPFSFRETYLANFRIPNADIQKAKKYFYNYFRIGNGFFQSLRGHHVMF